MFANLFCISYTVHVFYTFSYIISYYCTMASIWYIWQMICRGSRQTRVREESRGYCVSWSRRVDVSDHLSLLLCSRRRRLRAVVGFSVYFNRPILYRISCDRVVLFVVCSVQVLWGFCIYYSQYILFFWLSDRSPDLHPAMIWWSGLGDCFRSLGKY